MFERPQGAKRVVWWGVVWWVRRSTIFFSAGDQYHPAPLQSFGVTRRSRQLVRSDTCSRDLVSDIFGRRLLYANGFYIIPRVLVARATIQTRHRKYDEPWRIGKR